MAAHVLYRKWRPQRFADVVGQDPVTRTLMNALATGRVAHAYLFCGPRGTGKTSMGRILAKALNCVQNGKGEPCGQCAVCSAIADGRALDLIEIDAASNRGIDEIRSLREKVNFSPGEARYKVYIIDEVHMLTKEAFNALLKTLEEPPPHTIFVLATTEAHRLPATVISRCQRFDFRRIPLEPVVDRLAQICKAEGVEASREALVAIARGAGGSLRDALNVLEQIAVGHERGVDLKDVRDLLGVGDEALVRPLAEAALRGDIGAGVAAINDALGQGADVAQFHRALMEYLRGLMLARAGATDSLDVPAEEREAMRRQAAQHPMERIVRAVRAFGQAGLRGAGSASAGPLPLELALVEAAAPSEGRAPAAAPPPQPASRAPERAPSGPRPVRQQAPASVPPAVPLAPRSPARPPGPPPSPQDRAPTAPQPAPSLADGNGAMSAGPEQRIALLKQSWRSVIEASKGQRSKYRLDALLRSGSPLSIEGETIMLGFTHKKFVDMMNEELENPASRKALEDAVERIVGARHQVRCTVAERPPRQARGHLVRAAMDELGARIVEGGGSEP